MDNNIESKGFGLIEKIGVRVKTKIMTLNKRQQIILLASALIIIVPSLYLLPKLVFGGHGGEMITPSANGNRVAASYGRSNVKSSGASMNGEMPEYDYTEAPDHIGERATVKGNVIKVFTAKSGVTFFDFCEDFKDCPFSVVIFASDLDKFKDVLKYQRDVAITGTIKDYQGKAEIVLNSPDQIK